MGDIVEFKGGSNESLNNERAELAAFIEDIAERARQGNITGVAIAFILDDNATVSAWRNFSGVPYGMMLGAITQLQARYIKKHHDGN